MSDSAPGHGNIYDDFIKAEYMVNDSDRINQNQAISKKQELERPTNPKAEEGLNIPEQNSLYPREHSWGTPSDAGEVRVIDEKTGGAKGQKDCELGAVDPTALWEVGKIAAYGGKKYARYNFVKGFKWSLSYDALQRHLMLFWAGEDKDAESGLYHIAHAAWHCLALLTFMLRHKGTDDRFPK